MLAHTCYPTTWWWRQDDQPWPCLQTTQQKQKQSKHMQGAVNVFSGRLLYYHAGSTESGCKEQTKNPKLANYFFI